MSTTTTTSITTPSSTPSLELTLIIPSTALILVISRLSEKRKKK
ncbi:MAG: hypothetical protein ACW97X_01415 [Candidatus Hodarchaeales archaeon]